EQYNAINIVISIEYEVNNIDKLNQAFFDDAKKFNPIKVDINTTKQVSFDSYSSYNSSTLEERDIEFPLLGGNGISFWVRSGDSFYLTTCGHCTLFGPIREDGYIHFFHIPWNESDALTENYVGPMVMYTMQESDWGFVLKSNFSKFKPSAFIRNSDLQLYPELGIADYIMHPDDSMIGSIVCISGHQSHRKC
ncbi:8003_t:CDS:2, partial [Racocetra fulgida]